MSSIPVSVYRSMLRICRKNDPELKKYLKTGIMTSHEKTFPFYHFKYIYLNRISFVYGPYPNESANLLSFSKMKIRNNSENDDNAMEQLFYAHRELPNFFTALKNLEEEDLQIKNQQIRKQQINVQEARKPFSDNSKPTSFGSSFF